MNFLLIKYKSLACVNCVRWSCGGNYLASGGDDKLVMVWRMSGTGSSTVFGGSGKINVESWRCIATLRGHAGRDIFYIMY